MERLLVNEIFRSLQGEGTRTGRACVFVRLTGCNLRCSWCDTAYAYEDGREMAIGEIVAEVRRLGGPLVCVTGGEPLVQAAAPGLLTALCDGACEVLLETNGSMDISGVDERVVRCVDVKCPGSGMAGSMLWSNLDGLRASDEVKFILAGRADYDYARRVIDEHGLGGRCPVIFTPAGGRLEARELAAWMLADENLPPAARLGIQLHKVLWPGMERGV